MVQIANVTATTDSSGNLLKVIASHHCSSLSLSLMKLQYEVAASGGIFNMAVTKPSKTPPPPNVFYGCN